MLLLCSLFETLPVLCQRWFGDAVLGRCACFGGLSKGESASEADIRGASFSLH